MVRGLFFSLLYSCLLIGSFIEASKVPDNLLLPVSHPITPVLDHLFSQSRAIFHLKSLKKAGFIYCEPREFTDLVIARHPEVPGYLFKLYLDVQRPRKNKPVEYFWMLRVEGASLARKSIQTFSLENVAKVPRKWLYQLPKTPKVPEGYHAKLYILVEEDMELVSKEENISLWRSSTVTKELLEAVYIVLKEAGLSDCAKPDNIPFSIDGKISFIDTEIHSQKVPFKKLNRYLSHKNQAYWKTLTKQ